jgi:hypothetical protein
MIRRLSISSRHHFSKLASVHAKPIPYRLTVGSIIFADGPEVAVGVAAGEGLAALGQSGRFGDHFGAGCFGGGVDGGAIADDALGVLCFAAVDFIRLDHGTAEVLSTEPSVIMSLPKVSWAWAVDGLLLEAECALEQSIIFRAS